MRRPLPSQVLYYAAASVTPAAVFFAGKTEDRRAWIAAAVVFLALVKHRDVAARLRSLLPGDKKIVEAPDDSDDDEDLPSLVPLVAGQHDWDDPQPRHDAYIWCRHDLDVCTRTVPPDAQRTWDDVLGSVPTSAARRWESSRREIVVDHPSSDWPPPRHPVRATVR